MCLTNEERDRILGCADIAVLDRWIDRIWAVESVSELFADGTAE